MKPLNLSRPHLVVLVGIPGSGKTAFADRFAETFQAPFINPSALQQIAFASQYGNKEHEVKAQALAGVMITELFKTKQTIIYEESTGSRRARQELAQQANKAGYTPLFVWVQTDVAEANRRATRRVKDKVSMTPEEFEQAVRRFTVPVASEKAVVISGKHTYAAQLKNVLIRLASDRTPQPVDVPPRRTLIR